MIQHTKRETYCQGVEDAASQLTKACDGMCVSNAMREAGLTPWRAYAVSASVPLRQEPRNWFKDVYTLVN